jgi:hypothetical protein
MAQQATVATVTRRRSPHDDFVQITEVCQTILDVGGSAMRGNLARSLGTEV